MHGSNEQQLRRVIPARVAASLWSMQQPPASLCDGHRTCRKLMLHALTAGLRQQHSAGVDMEPAGGAPVLLGRISVLACVGSRGAGCCCWAPGDRGDQGSSSWLAHPWGLPVC